MSGDSPALRLQLAWVGVAVLLAIAAIAIGIARLGAPGDDGGPATGAAQLSHVHGLAIDPGDGALYAGTHYGLYRAADGAVEGPIGDVVQDFMGFTIIDAGHYLASGHPGRGQDAPSNLGLLESTDGGLTWVARSLAGEADFHALDHRHDTVYGYNAVNGEFVVSTDLETWELRSTTPMADFAVSPTDPDELVATTQQGPAYSTDGGRSFRLLEDAPPLVLVDWADDGTVVGVGARGAAYAGPTPFDLVAVGELGDRPEALLVAGASEMYAAAGGRLLVSTDGGATWIGYSGS